MKTLTLALMITVLCLSASTFAGQKIYDFLPDGGTMPKILQKVEPSYNDEVLNSNFEGKVFVRVALDKEGKIIDDKVSVIRNSSKNEEVAKSAVEAVKKYQFAPAKIDQEAVNYWLTVPVKFQISKAKQIIETQDTTSQS